MTKKSKKRDGKKRFLEEIFLVSMCAEKYDGLKIEITEDIFMLL